DAWGNLQMSPMAGKAHGGNFTLSATPQNQPTGLGYDAAGNMTSCLSATYTFDQENRLLSTAGMSYTYDGDGQRVLKSQTSGGAPVKRYWSMGGNTLAEGDGSGNLTAEYIYFSGKRVARIDLPANTCTTTFPTISIPPAWSSAPQVRLRKNLILSVRNRSSGHWARSQ